MPSILETHDTLVGALDWGRGNQRKVLVYRREHGGREFVRLRTFNRHRSRGCWYPTSRGFVIPMENAFDLSDAIDTAAMGDFFSPPPEWYADFEAQYQALRRS